MIFQTEETRSLILDTAWKLFMDRGFFDTQMKDVAAATGLSRTSLYRYFQDKNDLAMALVERIFDNFVSDESWFSLCDSSGTPLCGLDSIERYLKEHWLSPAFRDQFLFLAEFDAYFSGTRIPPGFNEDIRRAVHFDADDTLSRLFKKGVEDGSIRPDIDIHLTMMTVLNAVRGLHHRILLRGKALIEVSSEELEKMPETLVDYLIDGLRNRYEGEK